MGLPQPVPWAALELADFSMHERHLRRKWTVRANGRRIVLLKKPVERAEHVWMKALIWALYLPRYPGLAIEISVGDRYKPDVVQLGPGGRPEFWGEAGKVGVEKTRTLLKRYPDTHFALGKWAARLDPHVGLVERALDGLRRSAPVDLIAFPSDSADRFIDPDGLINIHHDALTWRRLGPDMGNG